jgi:membrane-associated protease RseP (regulator of RpoE activity)
MQQANATGSILEINNVPILSPQIMQGILNSTPPGTVITVGTTSGNYSIITVARPDNGTGSFIGISGPYGTHYMVKAFAEPFFPAVSGLITLLQWIFILNLGIGMINLLPLKPLDGGLIMEDIVRKYMSKSATKKVVTVISLTMLALLLFNIFGPAVF